MFSMVFGKILGMVGGVASATAEYRNQVAQSDKMRFDASMADRNAELARQDQQLAAIAGVIDRTNISKDELTTRGEARTGYASGNVALDGGTPLEFDISVAEKAAMDRERSRDDEAVAISRLKTEEQGLLASARMMRKASKSMKRSARLSFGGNVLSTVGQGMSSFGGK